MAENKREDWEIDRDRLEISQLLARYRNITHRRIADLLFERRTVEYKQALKELDALDADSGIPNAPPPPYRLTRQMIDYDIKAIRTGWRKESRQKFEEHLSRQLASAYELHSAAWEGYERTIGESNELQEDRETVALKTTVAGVIDGLEEKTLAGLLSTLDLKRPVTLPGATRIKLRRKKAQQLGDPRFLAIADKAQERIDKLLGLNAPQEVNLNTPGAGDIVLVAGFDPKQWDEAAAQRNRELEQKHREEEGASAADSTETA